MKTKQFAIMAVLLFGLAASPVFQNGLAYAQEENQTDTTPSKEDQVAKKAEVVEQKKEISKQVKDSRDNAPGTSPEDRERPINGTPIDRDTDRTPMNRDDDRSDIDREALKEQRRATMDQKTSDLKERFANMSEEKQQQIKDRMQAMKEQRGLITPSAERTAMMDMTVEERQAYVEQLREERSADREARQNMSPEDRQAFIEQKRAEMKEKRENSVSPRDQLSLGSLPSEVMCIEGYEVVLKVSDGLPRCMASDTAAILVERGFATYPEE